MVSRLESHKKFQESLGAFIIAFSEVEYALAELCALSEKNLPSWREYLAKNLGLSLDDKLKHLSKFIKSDLSELNDIWIEQQDKIRRINEDRRYLAHGFAQYYLPHKDGIVSTYIRRKIGKEKYSIDKKDYSSIEINRLTETLRHIQSGKNGIYGEFNTEFVLLRVNKWNEAVSDEMKIVYKVNNEIISDWKGK